MRPLLILLALLLAAPASALQPPVGLEELAVLSRDLRAATAMAHAEARTQDPTAPATHKLLVLSRLAFRFERLVPAFREDPAQLVTDFRGLLDAWEETRVQVDRSAPPEVALSFQWVTVLVARMATHFGDDRVSLAELTPGSELPAHEGRYSPEGRQGLADQVHILANQIYLQGTREPTASPAAVRAWLGLTEAAWRVRQDPDAPLADLDRSWREALPRYFALHPDGHSQENYSLLLSNYVRLRAASAQLGAR